MGRRDSRDFRDREENSRDCRICGGRGGFIETIIIAILGFIGRFLETEGIFERIL